ncbi:MAG: Hsp33 family molecular chaperone, partial [Pseudomonadota bacterium]
MEQTPSPIGATAAPDPNVFEMAAIDDRVLPLSVNALDVRGRAVRLGPALDAILSRHDYPPAVRNLVGQAVVLASLLGTAMKFKGRFILQTNTDGPVDMVVADFTTPNHLRGYARFDADKLAAVGDDPAALIGSGYLALTVDQGEHMQRYQGIVPLEGGDLIAAAHTYFQQSEQIPTKLKVAVAESLERGGGSSWRAGGLMVQHLPPEGGKPRDLDPGDGSIDARADDPAWEEAVALVDTVEDHELVDPTLASERLLYRLFHERGVHVFDGLDVIDQCHCSGDRLKAAI